MDHLEHVAECLQSLLGYKPQSTEAVPLLAADIAGHGRRAYAPDDRQITSDRVNCAAARWEWARPNMAPLWANRRRSWTEISQRGQRFGAGSTWPRLDRGVRATRTPRPRRRARGAG